MTFRGFRVTLMIFTMVGSLPLDAQDIEQPPIASRHWLKGHWERMGVNVGTSAFEQWEIDVDEAMKGKGVTKSHGQITFVEKLSIVEVDGSPFYAVDVEHNPSPVYFRITELSDLGFECENPLHDFPKKITYTLNGDRLDVNISGGGRSSVFMFVKSKDE